MESIAVDLRKVVDLSREVDRLTGLLQRNEPVDAMLMDALTVTMLVRYGRAFSPGSREHEVVRGLVAAMSAEQQSLHDYLIDVRNKHTAHSVNRLEETEVTVTLLEEPNGNATLHGIGIGHVSVVTLLPHMPRETTNLALWLLDRLDALIVQARAPLYKIAQEMGPQRIRTELEPWRTSVRVTSENPRKPRAKP